MASLHSIIALTSASLLSAVPTRVLFIGNSWTYVHDLPRQFQNVAESLGDEVEYASSTISGCTLLAQEASRDNTTRDLLEQDWDFIVLQDYSILPTVQEAREQYLKPAVKDFVSKKKQAKIVLYLTWGYHSGLSVADSCPSSDTEDCFPLGTLSSLTRPNCSESNEYRKTVEDFPCMGYSLARGYFDAKGAGADLVAPCGLAWQVVRGVKRIPASCKYHIDRQYSEPAPLKLPLHVFGGTDPDLLLYTKMNDLATKLGYEEFDKHQNTAGCYLNALTFYATIFGKSPLGAAAPNATWGEPPYPKILEQLEPNITGSQLVTMQRAAAGVVRQCGRACGFGTDVLV